jgi:hypothetical protein
LERYKRRVMEMKKWASKVKRTIREKEKEEEKASILR